MWISFKVFCLWIRYIVAVVGESCVIWLAWSNSYVMTNLSCMWVWVCVWLTALCVSLINWLINCKWGRAVAKFSAKDKVKAPPEHTYSRSRLWPLMLYICIYMYMYVYVWAGMKTTATGKCKAAGKLQWIMWLGIKNNHSKDTAEADAQLDNASYE